MTIFQKARELGEMLSETVQGKRLADAKYVFDGNEQAQKLFFEYNDYRRYYRERTANGEVSEEDNKKFEEFVEKIQANDIICELLTAQNEFSDLSQMIFEIARATAEGEMPSESLGGCTGSCATCGGCG